MSLEYVDGQLVETTKTVIDIEQKINEALNIVDVAKMDIISRNNLNDIDYAKIEAAKESIEELRKIINK